VQSQQFGETIDIPAYVISFNVPFTGDARLLDLQASTRSYSPPSGRIRENELVFDVVGEFKTAEEIKEKVSAYQETLVQMLGWANQEVHTWEPLVRASVEAAVEARRQRLEHAAALSDTLDFPLIQPGAN
jgi:hypothetical protein